PESVRPMPGGKWTSGNTKKGRWRPRACFNTLHRESLNETATAMTSRQISPRGPPFQTSTRTDNIIRGINAGFPLAQGINTSRKELLNVKLTKRNRSMSIVWSQCMRDQCNQD